jgi:hypothetical protein
MFLPRRHHLPSRALAPGSYLTDGHGLYRVISRFDDSRSLLVVIEDCRTLEANAFAAVELRAMRFRRVRSSGVSGAPVPAAPAPATRSLQTAG